MAQIRNAPLWGWPCVRFGRLHVHELVSGLWGNEGEVEILDEEWVPLSHCRPDEMWEGGRMGGKVLNLMQSMPHAHYQQGMK